MKHFFCTKPRVRIFKASRVRKSPSYNKVDKLTRGSTPLVKVNLMTGITTFKKKVSTEALTKAIQTGNYQKVMREIPWDKMHEDLHPASATLLTGMGKSAEFTLMALPAPVRTDLRYDTKNPAVHDYINTRIGELVTGIKGDTQTSIQNMVTRQMNEALSPRQVADQIKGSIGLYPKLEKAVVNYRTGLLKNGTAPGQVDRMTGAYQEKLLDYRAMMIARTETRNANNMAQLQVWRAAVDKNLIGKGSKKVWVVDGDPCEICLPMDGQAVGLDESWEVEYPDGSVEELEIPSFAHPHCYCGQEIEIEDADNDDEDKSEDNDDQDEGESDE